MNTPYKKHISNMSDLNAKTTTTTTTEVIRAVELQPVSYVMEFVIFRSQSQMSFL